jgi:flagellar basal body P-ring formation protein FlgA
MHIRQIVQALLGGALFAASTGAFAQSATSPIPKDVIYPGQIIRDEMLIDAPAEGVSQTGAALPARVSIVGKMARRTLLPGQAIPLAAIDNPRLVAIGAEVKLVFIDGGLQIVAYGAALQDGALGDSVKVRNSGPRSAARSGQPPRRHRQYADRSGNARAPPRQNRHARLANPQGFRRTRATPDPED